MLDVDRTTLYRWIEDEGLQQSVVDGRNARLDFAESKLDINIKNGDTTAIIFLLKTLGKDRGYVEKREYDHSGINNTPPQVNIYNNAPPLAGSEDEIEG